MNNEHIFHIIKDPVHGSMEFTIEENNWIKPFIDSTAFQRLRHIKQLGMGDLIFPGAVHTRFNHCIGASYVASQIAHKLGLSASERQLVTLACLLHDIGHGPFSHAFEDLFQHQAIRHEEWTSCFLEEFTQEEFLKIFNERNPAQPLNAEKIEQVKKLIMHQETKQLLLADIVSSQLDADRLDYLLRDSHFCGVNYGEYDFRWLLNCLTPVESENGLRLGITGKGIGVIEHYLMARRLMMRNVYHHGKKYAAEYYLQRCLALLAKSLLNEKTFTFLKDSTLVKLLINIEKFNQDAQKAPISQQDKQTFIKQNYHLYKQLYDYDVYALIRELANLNEPHEAVILARYLFKRHLPKVFKLNEMSLEKIRLRLSEVKSALVGKIYDWQIALLTPPYQSYKGEKDPILCIDKSGHVSHVHEHSYMIAALSDRDEHSCFLSVDEAIIAEPLIKAFLKDLSHF